MSLSRAPRYFEFEGMKVYFFSYFFNGDLMHAQVLAKDVDEARDEFKATVKTVGYSIDDNAYSVSILFDPADLLEAKEHPKSFDLSGLEIK